MTIEPCRLSSWQLLEKSNWHAVLSPMLVLFKFCSHFLSFDRKLPFLDVANNKTRNSSRNKTKHQWYSRMIFGAPGKYHTRLIPLFPKTNSHKLGRRSEETSRYKKKKKRSNKEERRLSRHFLLRLLDVVVVVVDHTLSPLCRVLLSF